LLFRTSLQAQFLIPMAPPSPFRLGFLALLVLLVIPAADVGNLKVFKEESGSTHAKQAKTLPRKKKTRPVPGFFLTIQI